MVLDGFQATSTPRSSICSGAPDSARGRTSSTCIVPSRFNGALTRLLEYERIPDDVDAKIGVPGYVLTSPRGAVPAKQRHHRCAPAMAVPDGAHRPAAAGEDGALLAQPLRHRLLEDRRHPGRGRSDALHGREADRRSGGSARPDRAVPRLRPRQLSRPARQLSPRTRRCCSGSTATRTRAHGRRRTSAARSWSCSRWASGTTPRPTSTRPPACSPAGTWPDRARGRWHAALRVRLQRRTSTTPAAKTFSFPIYSDGEQDDHGSRGGGRHAGRPRFDRGVWRRNPETARYLAKKLYRFFVSESRRRAGVVLEPRRRRVYFRSGYDMKAVMREVFLSPRVRDPRQHVHALRLAGGVRRARDEGHRLERLLS